MQSWKKVGTYESGSWSILSQNSENKPEFVKITRIQKIVKKLGKLFGKLGNLGVRPNKKAEKRSSLLLGWKTRKVQKNLESSTRKLGTLIWKIKKVGTY